MTTKENNLSNHLIERSDTTPIDTAMSAEILKAFRDAGFEAIDIGHHIAIYSELALSELSKELGNGTRWNCACIYLEDNALTITAVAERWWGLFHLFLKEEDDPRFLKFWETVDSLKSTWELFQQIGGEVIQGTVGELDLNPKRKSKQVKHDHTKR